MVTSLSKLADPGSRGAWVDVTEIPARQMAEYGDALPEPIDEQTLLEQVDNSLTLVDNRDNSTKRALR